MSDKRISYFNTLILTVVTGIISLIVLSMLFFDFGKAFIYLIIVFEIGVFIIIGICIYNIIKAEQAKTSKKDYVVTLDQCPDYYTRVVNAGTEYCMNYYMGKDALGTEVLTRLYPMKNAAGTDLDVSQQILSNNLVPNAAISDHNNFKLFGLQNEEKINDMHKKCDVIFQKPPPSLSNTTYDSHSIVPWTYARSRCAGLSQFV